MKYPTIDSKSLTVKETKHNNGIPNETIHYYHDSIRHGLYTANFPNGKLDRTGYFYANQMFGKWKFYDSLGHLLEIATYRNNELNGADTTFYISGQIEAYGKYIMGKEEGPWMFFHPNGKLKHKTSYIEGIEDFHSFASYDSLGKLTTDTSSNH